MSLRDITETTLRQCDGSWGICAMSPAKPDELVVACNGSPLVIGLGVGDSQTFVASETSAFNRYTKKFISLKDGEIGVINSNGIHGIVDSNNELSKRVEVSFCEGK